ncbi:hypothetical protein VNO78_26276 [Psophocarpus tetragonolobus]|uniref:Polygalacturonase n=1 Tax=Psophocarpus tetragonolobus TaxID=3891 RepID=A0AAN9S048_PSOTE
MLLSYLLILVFVSPCLCVRWPIQIQDSSYNVMDFGAHGDGNSDDSQAFLSAWQKTCETQDTPTLVIPAEGVFMVKNTTLKGPCNATQVNIQLQGKIVAPSKDAWEKGVTIEDNSFLIMISHVNGLAVDGTGGQIDGLGSDWWKCRTCPRPKVINFESCNDVKVNNLTITNSPRAHISVDYCKGAIFSNISIYAPGDSPNTDGFDIHGSSNISIQDSTIQTGDDCIAINGGCSYINVTGVFCGPGHGISVGSLGRNGANDTVEQVYVRNCTFNNTQNGARIKTFENGGIEVSDVIFCGFHGTSAKDLAINLACSSSGCFNIVLDNIEIVSSLPGKPAYCSCSNAHGTSTSTEPSCSNCLMK